MILSINSITLQKFNNLPLEKWCLEDQVVFLLGAPVTFQGRSELLNFSGAKRSVKLQVGMGMGWSLWFYLLNPSIVVQWILGMMHILKTINLVLAWFIVRTITYIYIFIYIYVYIHATGVYIYRNKMHVIHILEAWNTQGYLQMWAHEPSVSS